MNKNCFGKKYYYALLVLLSFSSMLTFGQSRYNTTDWRFSNPKQFGFTINDVDFYDNNVALAVGSDGGIAKTTDGGANWTYGPFSFVNAAGQWVKPPFSDVHFVTSSIAYAVGSLGTMIKTTDAGATWTRVITPLTPSARNINTVWFVNKDTGYIGGQYNTIDSIPKLYFTKNGGATWDSMAAPGGGVSRIGYVANPSLAPVLMNVTAKAKEIYRIMFTSDSVGYISGSGLGPFDAHAAINTTTCVPNGTLTTSGSHHASLLWKFTKGVLTDYSLSKERLGYDGVPTGTLTCSSRYGSLNAASQTMRAMHIVNDSTILLMSFNNNIVIKVFTGKNDSTQNIAVPGLYEKGRYQVLNFPFPPNGVPIPNPQVLLASNPYSMVKAANGKICTVGNFGLMWTTVDTGKNWVREVSLPQGKNYSTFGTWAIDIAPNGKFLTMGTNGVVADSVPGTSWKSNYITVPVTASYNKIEFADCNNGMAVGGSSITVTTDGGATWIDKNRPDFSASFYSINSVAYHSLSKAYFAVSNGTIYASPDKGTTLDPVFSDFSYQMTDVATKGNDTVWASGYTTSSVPAASRTAKIFRSIDGGVNWTTNGSFPVGTLAVNLTDIEFPTNLIGYAAGNRDTIYKTTDGGTTWNKLPLPTPGITPQITYTDMFALDANTVFITGNGFPRKVVFRTTDGGATWTDITNNILALGGGNLNCILMHDINNGYVGSPGGVMYKTTNGGTTWSIEIAPTSNIFATLAFAPRSAPVSVPFANRKLFVTGANVSGAPIMEFGQLANTAVNSTETIVNTNCATPNGGSITINATGAIAPYTYSINGVNFQTSNVFNGLSQGPKTITIKDAYCGILTKTINISFTDNLTLTANNDTLVCAGAPVPMLATTNLTGATYAWTPAGGLSATNINNPVATVNSNSTFTVKASLNGCERTEAVNVNIKPNPVINAGADKIIVAGDEVLLNGTGILNPVSIAWTPAASILSGANTYTALVKPAATTTFTLTVKNNDNCTSTDDATVTVIPNCIKVMNAFTPNGDGMNDRWLVTNGSPCSKEIKVAVYNRYGNIVYSNNNYANDWDGTYKGKPVADGTYYYTVTLTTITGKTIMAKGDVTILR
jgi:gliding motility-associated-like protein